jgi:hypothetical protein
MVVFGFAVIPAVGAVMFCVIVAAAVVLHPFAPVTVTVYVPGLVTFKVAADPRMVVPFDQEYVPPPVAVKAMEVRLHVSSLAFGALEMAAIGAAIVCVIVTLEVAVQPFAPVIMAV